LSESPYVGEIRMNPHDRPLTSEELSSAICWSDALLSQLTDDIDGNLLRLNPNLKIIANFAVGFNNIDITTAAQLNIPVTNTPDVLTETTADLTFALLMACARRIVESDKYMREGKYKGWDPLLLLGCDIHHKTIGIVGFGRIGHALAKRAKGFDMNILYSDIEEKEYAQAIGAQRVSLEELLRKSDFVSLHPFLDQNTKHLISSNELKMMKRSSFLINVSRGAVVDEKALVKALNEGWIAGAALDVFEKEPECEPELKDMNNVILVPHIGSATIETRTSMGIMAAKNILARFKKREITQLCQS